MPTALESVDIGCATEIFVATALLHCEYGERSDFTIPEIVDRAARENMTGKLRSGLNVHASHHCVANRAPNPARHKMLFATGKHTRRLLLPGDEVHPERTGRIFPEVGEIPEKYLPLLTWAKKRYEEGGANNAGGLPANEEKGQSPQGWLESLFELEGLGREYWKDTNPDEFVRKLREGWE